MVVTEDFAAVMDGATTAPGSVLGGLPPGRFAALLGEAAFRLFPPQATAGEAVAFLSGHLAEALARVRVSANGEAIGEPRAIYGFVAVSFHWQEVWRGLRKAAAVRLAELGASVHELKAVLGHRTLQEVERYTRAAAQAGLAATAFSRLSAKAEANDKSHSSAPTPKWDENADQPLDQQRASRCLVPRTGREGIFPPNQLFSQGVFRP